MLAAAVQFRPEWGQPDRNRAKLLLLIAQAARTGAELVVLPEMCTTGYIFENPDAIRPYCEDRQGRSVRFFQAQAEKYNLTLCFGWGEIEPDSGRLFNSAAVCRPAQEILFYRKRLLFEADETWAEPGDTPYPMWRSKEGLLCSLGICMDLNDDAFIAHLIAHQVRVVAFPTNWLEQGLRVWDYWAWRITGTRTCLVASNRYGTEQTTTFCGSSAVLDGRLLLAWTERTGDAVVSAFVPPDPSPLPDAP
ncbi:MAG: carbon-nitrogen hydrolase family protein [Vulcanimicrobiota bacterium]